MLKFFLIVISPTINGSSFSSKNKVGEKYPVAVCGRRDSMTPLTQSASRGEFLGHTGMTEAEKIKMKLDTSKQILCLKAYLRNADIFCETTDANKIKLMRLRVFILSEYFCGLLARRS